MRIAVTTFGSEGDFRPYLALARGLRRAGHEAFRVASSLHAPRAAGAGIPFRSLEVTWELADALVQMTKG